MDNRFKSVVKLKKMGFTLIPEWDKRPVVKDWTNTTYTLDELETFWEKQNYNIGVVVGKMGLKSFCVIDIDVKNGQKGLENWTKFAEEENIDTDTLTVETPSGGLHLYYYCKPDTFGANLHILEGVELKGNKGKVTAPPSESPDGKKYKWKKGTHTIKNLPPAVYKLAELKKKNYSSVEFTTDIPKGERNEALFKMGCSLVRNVDSNQLAVMLHGFNSKFDDPMETQEVDAIIQSVLKYQVAKIHKPPVSKNTQPTDWMKYYDSQYIICSIGGKTTVLRKSDNYRQSFDEAKKYHLSEKIINKSSNNEQAFPKWLESRRTVRAKGLTFDPDLEPGLTGEDFWNIWKGYPYSPQEGDCSLFLEHAKDNVCNGDQDVYDFLLDWMAQPIQQPKTKIFVAVAIKGDQGSGKTAFVHHYLRLFGDSGAEIASGEYLWGNFNSLLDNKLMIYLDEAFWSGDKKIRGKLKNMITSPHTVIEYKGKDAIIMPNYMRFISTTNNDWGAAVEKGDRRWLSIRCSNGRIKDSKYFQEMEKQMQNGGYQALMKLLMERDISQRDWTKIPMTDARKEDMQQTMLYDEPMYEYLIQCLDGSTEHSCLPELLDNEVVFGEIFDKFVKWNQSRGLNIKCTSTSVGRMISKIKLPTRIVKRNKKTVKVYDLSRESVEKTLENFIE